MNERGYKRTWIQCQRMIKGLKAKLKETKNFNKQSGHGRISCPFYEELDCILGDKPSCQPHYLVDSSANQEDETPSPPPSPGNTSKLITYHVCWYFIWYQQSDCLIFTLSNIFGDVGECSFVLCIFLNGTYKLMEQTLLFYYMNTPLFKQM